MRSRSVLVSLVEPNSAARCTPTGCNCVFNSYSSLSGRLGTLMFMRSPAAMAVDSPIRERTSQTCPDSHGSAQGFPDK
jgi:hypothetical protein